MFQTWLPLLGFTAFFLILHAVAMRWESAWPRAFKLSRGMAAFLLTVLGFAALMAGFEHWPQAFLYHHPEDDWMRLGLLVVMAHLLSDFLWMGVGTYRHGITQRRDLIVHHGVGIVAYAFALHLRVGYALSLVAMTTELMPVTTGLHALGKKMSWDGVVQLSDRARLYLLIGFRLPVWVILFVLVSRVLFLGEPGDLALPFSVALAGTIGLICLDVYWIRKALNNLDFY
ncbi:MAG: hypothetical protein DWQ01_16885 [Planctomycetota bacterium]|nr:MAG: hypothetical protein DWQ01_16885 [Planctomycetota bacterium]